MECLQQQRADPADEHRCIGVHPPNRILIAEPALAVAPDLGVLCLEVSGEAFSNRSGDAGSQIRKCPDRHIAERTRRQ
jgi:hypothetical protein